MLHKHVSLSPNVILDVFTQKYGEDLSRMQIKRPRSDGKSENVNTVQIRETEQT